MNVVRAMIKPTMILTVLIAISCGLQPMSNKGSDFSSHHSRVQPVEVSLRQDTPKVSVVRPLTPAQIEMARKINKAFSSIDDISKSTVDISEATKEIVATNQMLVSMTVSQQKQIDSLAETVIPLYGRIERLQVALDASRKEAEVVRKSNEDEARMAKGFRNLMTRFTSYIFIPFCVFGFIIGICYFVLWIREERFKNLVKHGA
ncbi:hypothetical protein [Sphingobacterium mizutaii]|uniref:hypothetical protein n=1 Tax=Sphingobacterium mizutaii TaxID=1010 RepID=UPI00289FBA32|nr:hypothetical protein [Sphingobacterium mizutaii]